MTENNLHSGEEDFLVGAEMTFVTRLRRGIKKLMETWVDKEKTVIFKLNWTIGHTLRLTFVSLRILRMLVDNPKSYKYIFTPRPASGSNPNNIPEIMSRRQTSIRETLLSKWFSYQAKYEVSEKFSETLVLGRDVTVIIPIYVQIDLARHLLDQVENEQKTFPFSVIIVDDCFDEHTSEWLKARTSNWKSCTLIINPKNIGFLRSVNFAFKQIETKIAVLLNSDLELNSNSISRLVNPLSQPGIALATALATESGSNLSISIPKGRHWKEVDNWLGSLTPHYPDAHTAIGYALSVNLHAVDKSEFFSLDFMDGYGEDSDLHFRVLQKGFRSVIVDNLLVRHHSGSSYKTKKNLKILKAQNRKTFLKKWGPQYKKENLKWEWSNPVNRVRGFIEKTHRSKPLDAQVLVLIPSLDDTSGGGRMVISLFEELWRMGTTARILSTIRDLRYEPAWSPVSERVIKNANIGIVVSTGSGTFARSESLSALLGAKETLFFQGPEMFFDNGAQFGSTLHHLNRVSNVVSGSPYLSNLAQIFGSTNVVDVPLGPDTQLFFRDKKIAKENKVLISSRRNHDKGTVFSTPLAIHFQRMGFIVETFGPTTDSFQVLDGIKHHGQLDHKSLNKLFNEARYVVDTSIFEGLGLTPLEALRAECVPIATRKGGLESVGIPEGWVVWLDSPFVDIDSLRSTLDTFESQIDKRSVSELDSFFDKRNFRIGISAAARFVTNGEIKHSHES